jgi:hypothetical protein
MLIILDLWKHAVLCCGVSLICFAMRQSPTYQFAIDRAAEAVAVNRPKVPGRPRMEDYCLGEAEQPYVVHSFSIMDMRFDVSFTIVSSR